jgi:hypothetical protein
MKLIDSNKNRHYQLLETHIHTTEFENDKSLSEQSKKHYKHKPYEYDLGGKSNDKNK